MIKSVKLTNFRKHRALSLGFSGGLSVVRGLNEAGKSTVTEGILYALFGSSALRTNFSDAVTHGEPESSLKVELELCVRDRCLTFRRGKSGAEVIENGAVIVTGQKEVTNFTGTLLDINPGAAMNLMVANQGALRGVLQQGPKATSEFVEQLAQFDLFDTLLEAAQSKLMLGNTGAMEAEVALAQAALDTMGTPEPPNLAAMSVELDELREAEQVAKAAYAPLDAAVKQAASALSAARVRVADRDNLVGTQIRDLDARLAKLERDRAELSKAASAPVATSEIERLKKAVQEQQLLSVKANIRDRVLAIKMPLYSWEGDEASLLARIAALDGALDDLRTTVVENEKMREVLASTIITSSTCGFCGQDVTAWPNVAEKNAKAAAQIATCVAAIASADAAIKEGESELAMLRRVLRDTQAVAWAAPHADWLNIDRSLCPPRISWVGGDVTIDPSVQSRLDDHLAREKSVQQAAAMLRIVEESIRNEAAAKDELLRRLSSFDTVDADLAQCRQDLEEAEKARLEQSSVVTECSAAVWRAEQNIDAARAAYESAKVRYDAARATLDTQQKLLNDMRFNNGLVKKIRAARPIISDKLWNSVLHSVSTMFSRIRGEQSVVTKERDGFKVNGQSVESLSGSTLDILALAIRVSLIKVFLPSTGFMILDEAGSACDAERAVSMYGFLKSAGFDQVIFVTHDEIGDSVSDQLIEL